MIKQIQTFIKKNKYKILTISILIILLIFYFYLPVIGEDPRPETEYKISIEEAINDELANKIYSNLEKNLTDFNWENNKYLSWSYYMWSDLNKIFFEDIYLDTKLWILEKNNLSYRIRYRWNTLEDILNYKTSDILPQRFEFQTKIYEDNFLKENNEKIALKNRYEIKNDYRLNFLKKIILNRNNLNMFMFIINNKISWNKFTPYVSLYSSIKNKWIKLDSKLIKKTYSIQERKRFHINKKTIFWYWDNPDNTFLISIDNVSIYSDENYNNIIWKFSEIEIDFERNTMFNLFDAINWNFKKHSYTQNELENIYNSFMSDQEEIKQIIEDTIINEWFTIIKNNKSKNNKIRSYY